MAKQKVCPLCTISTQPPVVYCWEAGCALWNPDDQECCYRTQQRGTIMLVAAVQFLTAAVKDLRKVKEVK